MHIMSISKAVGQRCSVTFVLCDFLKMFEVSMFMLRLVQPTNETNFPYKGSHPQKPSMDGCPPTTWAFKEKRQGAAVMGDGWIAPWFSVFVCRNHKETLTRSQTRTKHNKGSKPFLGIFFPFFFSFSITKNLMAFQTVRSSWIPWPGSDWYSAVQCLGALSAQWPAVLCRWKIWSSVPGPWLNGFLPKKHI